MVFSRFSAPPGPAALTPVITRRGGKAPSRRGAAVPAQSTECPFFRKGGDRLRNFQDGRDATCFSRGMKIEVPAITRYGDCEVFAPGPLNADLQALLHRGRFRLIAMAGEAN